MVHTIKAKLGLLRRKYRRRRLLRLMPKHSICAEIGVDRGEFSKEILRIVKPEQLYLIDIWLDEKIYSKIIEDFVGKDDITIWRETSKMVSYHFPNESLDWVYIDADHSYEAVEQDLHLWYPKIKKGGFITGDDYIRPNDNFGVKRAVDEFTRAKVIKIDKGQFILKK